MVSLYEIFHTAPAVKEFSAEEVAEIATSLAIRNQSMGITGVLCYRDREFYQILEGDRKVLAHLMDNIEDPTKHGNIHIVWEAKCYGRAFKNWGLCPVVAGDDMDSDLKAIKSGTVSTALQLFDELNPTTRISSQA